MHNDKPVYNLKPYLSVRFHSYELRCLLHLVWLQIIQIESAEIRVEMYQRNFVVHVAEQYLMFITSSLLLFFLCYLDVASIWSPLHVLAYLCLS